MVKLMAQTMTGLGCHSAPPPSPSPSPSLQHSLSEMTNRITQFVLCVTVRKLLCAITY